MTLVSDIAAKLVSSSLATALGTDIFAYRFPSSPLNAICIIPMSLKEPDPLLGSNSLDYPAFQIQVRNTNVKTAESSAEMIRTTLDYATLSGYVYIRTTRSRPVDLTNPDDLTVTGGPAYRFSVDFTTMKVR